MPRNRHHPGFRDRGRRWLVTVTSAEGELLFHGEAADWKEAQALCSEARAHSQALKIWLRDPYDKLRSWD
jgi:hypothetical protein